jgi:hypothetical protein
LPFKFKTNLGGCGADRSEHKTELMAVGPAGPVGEMESELAAEMVTELPSDLVLLNSSG